MMKLEEFKKDLEEKMNAMSDEEWEAAFLEKPNNKMKKLILRRYWSIPYEADGTDIIPFEYSSKEDAFVDFFSLKEKSDNYFKFAGNEWIVWDNLEDEVSFFDLDEWFDKYKTK